VLEIVNLYLPAHGIFLAANGLDGHE
jgi:hypothetical protein